MSDVDTVGKSVHITDKCGNLMGVTVTLPINGIHFKAKQNAVNPKNA